MYVSFGHLDDMIQAVWRHVVYFFSFFTKVLYIYFCTTGIEKKIYRHHKRRDHFLEVSLEMVRQKEGHTIDAFFQHLINKEMHLLSSEIYQ